MQPFLYFSLGVEGAKQTISAEISPLVSKLCRKQGESERGFLQAQSANSPPPKMEEPCRYADGHGNDGAGECPFQSVKLEWTRFNSTYFVSSYTYSIVYLLKATFVDQFLSKDGTLPPLLVGSIMVPPPLFTRRCCFLHPLSEAENPLLLLPVSLLRRLPM